MGPHNKNDDYDVIWVECDKQHVIVPRIKGVSLEKWFETLQQVASGSASTLAGTNAAGFPEMKEIIDDRVDYVNEAYYAFLRSLDEKTENQKAEYEKLLKSGMFWEFYPKATGVWEEDKYWWLTART